MKRKQLWQVISEHGFPAKLNRLIRSTLDGSKSSVRVAAKVSILFVILDALKLVDVLTIVLFNIARNILHYKSDSIFLAN